MLISNSHKFIFVHIFKTAGTSVREVFLPYSRLVDRLVYQYPLSRKAAAGINMVLSPWSQNGNAKFTGFRKHDRAKTIKEKMGPAYDAYFKFAIVRDPYDWMVSLYHYIRQSSDHHEQGLVQAMTFPEFVRFQVEKGVSLQSDYLLDAEGKLIVDYIGRFERLDEDLKAICDHLQLPYTPVPHKNKSARPRRKNSQAMYDAASLELMKSHFERDFRLLDYPVCTKVVSS